jgi:hypothetical protein
MNMTFDSAIPDWKLSRDGSIAPSVLVEQKQAWH